MTEKQKEQYKIRYSLDDYMCQRCCNPASQISHRIAKTKVNYKKYGKDIIDHNINLVSACCLECNDSFNIGNNPGKCNLLIEFITRNYNEIISSEKINKLLENY